MLEVWVAYVESHSYAWKMLFRDHGGGSEVEAYRVAVHARARAVLVDIIGSLRQTAIPARELEPLAELISMGMAAVVLWWIDDLERSREAIVDAIVRVWVGVLS